MSVGFLQVLKAQAVFSSFSSHPKPVDFELGSYKYLLEIIRLRVGKGFPMGTEASDLWFDWCPCISKIKSQTDSFEK